MSKKYFRYLLKSFWPTATVYITLFAVFLIIIPFIIDCFCMLLARFTIGHTAYMVAMGPACIFMSGLLPLLMHNRYFSKNRSDIILSMPMNRKQAFLTEGVFGLALITILTVVGYSIGCFLCFALGNGSGLFTSASSSFGGLPALYFACVVVYLSSVFAVSVSNSGPQAFLMIVMVNLLPLLLESVVTSPTLYRLLDRPSVDYWSSPTDVYTHYLSCLLGAQHGDEGPAFLAKCLLALTCQMVVWLGLDVLAFFEFGKLKSEHLGTVIPQRFGVVNTLTLEFGLGFALMGEFFMTEVVGAGDWSGYVFLIYMFALFLISVGYWISIFITRKKAKFRKDDWVRYAIAFAGGLVLGIVMYAILRAANPTPVNY